MNDQEIVERAVKQAEAVLREYIRPRQQRDCGQTMNRLLEILDNQNVAAALRRIDQSVQLNATIEGRSVVEFIEGRDAAFRRANQLLSDGIQDVQVILPDGTVLSREALRAAAHPPCASGDVCARSDAGDVSIAPPSQDGSGQQPPNPTPRHGSDCKPGP